MSWRTPRALGVLVFLSLGIWAPVGGPLPARQPAAALPAAPSLGHSGPPSRHCFEAAGESFAGTVSLWMASDGRVAGESDAVIHDEEAGYFTSYRQAFVGAAVGDRLELEVVTRIELDRQVTRESWTLHPGHLDTGRSRFELAPCGPAHEPWAVEEVLERVVTAAGLLTIGRQDSETGAVYTVRVDGAPVSRFDAGDEDQQLAAFPRPEVLHHFDPGVVPFDEVLLIQQHSPGAACNGGPLWFLGLRRDGTHAASSVIDFCGGPDPIVTREGETVRVEIPGGPPNRGEGDLAGEVWVYEAGEVRRFTGCGTR
jgi:hypothetical protein